MYKLNGWEMPGGVPGVVQTTDTVIIIVYTGCSHHLLGLSMYLYVYWREERGERREVMSRSEISGNLSPAQPQANNWEFRQVRNLTATRKLLD